MSYDPSAIPGGVNEKDLFIAYYDKEATRWVKLESVVNTLTKTITVSVSHFTAFAILGQQVIAPPAVVPEDFTISWVSSLPAKVAPGETVAIGIAIANHGRQSSRYQVTLKINGQGKEIRWVTVDAGATKQVSFDVRENVAGTYAVDVNGLTGSFTVEEARLTPPSESPAPPAPSLSPPLPSPPAPPAATPEKSPVSWPLLGGIIAAVMVIALLVFWLMRRGG